MVNEVYTEIFKEKELQMEESIDTQDLIKKLKEKSICMSVEKATAGLEIKNLQKERNLILEQKVATINQCNNLKEKITRLVREKELFDNDSKKMVVQNAKLKKLEPFQRLSQNSGNSNLSEMVSLAENDFKNNS